MKPVNCDYNMSFAECELAILRSAVDLAQEKIGRRVVSYPEIKNIIQIVENFLKTKKLVCYGGTAINNILPEHKQFYDKETELPDYDFFSPHAMNDAIELADLYYEKGYKEVQAKAGQHFGTYKVYVNFISIADITTLPQELFNTIKDDSITVNGILYCPPNFLRMSMYLELSRPAGDTSRWEKVMKRLTLLNETYPLTMKQCSAIDFQREMENKKNEDEIYNIVKKTLRNQDCVFFGGYAISLYSKYMPEKERKQIQQIPDFDVLSNDPDKTANIVKQQLNEIGIQNVEIINRDPIGEVIPEHREIRVGKDTIAFIYKPIGCHSYNVIGDGSHETKIATIDTMLSFYLAFLYANRPYYDTDRIICMSKYLFEVEQKNRLKQKGLLRRFSITCYGHQQSLEEIRAEKAEKFRQLQNKKGTKKYNEWFLSYEPAVDKKRGDFIELKPKKNKIRNKNKTLKKNKVKPAKPAKPVKPVKPAKSIKTLKKKRKYKKNIVEKDENKSPTIKVEPAKDKRTHQEYTEYVFW
jgi:hypothetical protein